MGDCAQERGKKGDHDRERHFPFGILLRDAKRERLLEARGDSARGTRQEYQHTIPMWLPVSTIATICVLIEIPDNVKADPNLELVFKERSHSEWKNAWHNEKYSRCRDTLIRHLYWACEKDIYRLTRRSNDQGYNDVDEVSYPWQSPMKAKRIFRFKRGVERRSGSSITKECCKSTGCTWEEYAEYCPTNKRYTSYV